MGSGTRGRHQQTEADILLDHTAKKFKNDSFFYCHNIYKELTSEFKKFKLLKKKS